MPLIDTIQKFFPWAATLPFLPKFLLSAVVVLLAALVLAVVWMPQAAKDEDAKKWPQDRTIDGLTRRLSELSAINARLLKVVAHGPPTGLYPPQIQEALKIDHDAAVYRAKELEHFGLVTIKALTDLNIRIDPRVSDVLRPRDPAKFLDGYLPDK